MLLWAHEAGDWVIGRYLWLGKEPFLKQAMSANCSIRGAEKLPLFHAQHRAPTIFTNYLVYKSHENEHWDESWSFYRLKDKWIQTRTMDHWPVSELCPSGSRIPSSKDKYKPSCAAPPISEPPTLKTVCWRMWSPSTGSQGASWGWARHTTHQGLENTTQAWLPCKR